MSSRAPVVAMAQAGVVLLLLSGCGAEPADEAAPTPTDGGAAEPAPDFDLERLSGGRVRLEDFRGKHLLIDFWATWCAPCVLEIPELNAFYARERERGVEVLAISVESDPELDLAGWVGEHGIAYPVAIGDEALAREYQAFAFPLHVLVGPEGQLLEALEPGYHDREELEELVDRYR